jgi:hypothetical protein
MPECTLTRPRTQPVGAEWVLSAEQLTVSPRGEPPLSLALREISALEGIDYELRLRVGDEWLGLSRLGGAGSTLHADLRRRWPLLRAQALRVAGSGEPRRYRGRYEGRPAEILAYPEVVIVAPDAGDVEPLFLADVAAAGFDESTYGFELRDWAGARRYITHLGGESRAFTQDIADRRAALAAQATALLADTAPTLDGISRARLAAQWLPGRFLSASALEELAPGLHEVLTARLAAGPRSREAAYLMKGRREDLHLAYLAPGSLGDEGIDENGAASETVDALAATPDAQGDPDSASAGDSRATSTGTAESMRASLWLLARRGRRWLLEAASEQDFATYELEGGDEVPWLAAHLLWTPQFSRQALYLPLVELAGPRAGLALPARDLPFLRELRGRFNRRLIHSGFESWRNKAEALAP